MVKVLMAMVVAVRAGLQVFAADSSKHLLSLTEALRPGTSSRRPQLLLQETRPRVVKCREVVRKTRRSAGTRNRHICRAVRQSGDLDHMRSATAVKQDDTGYEVIDYDVLHTSDHGLIDVTSRTHSPPATRNKILYVNLDRWT